MCKSVTGFTIIHSTVDCSRNAFSESGAFVECIWLVYQYIDFVKLDLIILLQLDIVSKIEVPHHTNEHVILQLLDIYYFCYLLLITIH